jgi:hypothetical protein
MGSMVNIVRAPDESGELLGVVGCRRLKRYPCNHPLLQDEI